MTVLFADIVDFTPMSAAMEAKDVVGYLNHVFTLFGELCDARGLEKIKTIGDAYMVAGGMPDPQSDHVASVADLALEMMATVGRTDGSPAALRIGIHTGPVVAGVIGTRKFFYDVWGDTVNMAARMESRGERGRIQVTGEVRAALADRFTFERHGMVDVKGKGSVGPSSLWGVAEPPAQGDTPGRRASPEIADDEKPMPP